MVRRGQVERIARGLYRRSDEVSELDTVASVCARIPDGVVCLLSALIIHDIGTQLPSEVWIAIDRRARRPMVDRLPVRIVRFSGPMLKCGIERRTIQGVNVRVTSPARTVVDCFRYRNKRGIDVAIEALKDAVQRRLATAGSIYDIAKRCRASSVIRPYIEAVLG
jgi:predicted transcriptional regulator of viral defense system